MAGQFTQAAQFFDGDLHDLPDPVLGGGIEGLVFGHGLLPL
jgi:hypothetical protein